MTELYICPMHPQVKSDKPGRCPICGMNLVTVDKALSQVSPEADKGLGYLTWKSYLPLGLIISLIFLTSLAIGYPEFELKTIIRSFMAGFFIVFAGFKLLDLDGFAQGYSTYDILAKKWYKYGYIYPFIELTFGLTMVLGLLEMQILLAEVFVMTFSGAGVLQKILKGERFHCVCLGTFLKVPLTKITLVEDFGMATLALLLLLIG